MSWKKFISDLSPEEDKLVGLIFGLALGDAIGSINEHKPPQTISIPDTQKDSETDNELTTTDETEQLIIFMRSMCANQRINPADLTHRLIDWASSDFTTTQRPSPDKITEMLLKSSAYLDAPWQAAQNLWKQSNGKFASSHALSRVAALGVLLPDIKVRENVTIGVTQLTHADSRCSVAACYYVNMIQKYYNIRKNETPDDKTLIDEIPDNLPDDIREIITVGRTQLVQEFGLHLRNTSFIYYAILALEWVAKVIDYSRQHKQEPSFTKVIKTLAECGGDADNNCAVAGSLLGVYMGYNKLPKSLIRLLSTRDELRDICQQWIAIQRMLLAAQQLSIQKQQAEMKERERNKKNKETVECVIISGDGSDESPFYVLNPCVQPVIVKPQLEDQIVEVQVQPVGKSMSPRPVEPEEETSSVADSIESVEWGTGETEHSVPMSTPETTVLHCVEEIEDHNQIEQNIDPPVADTETQHSLWDVE